MTWTKHLFEHLTDASTFSLVSLTDSASISRQLPKDSQRFTSGVFATSCTCSSSASDFGGCRKSESNVFPLFNLQWFSKHLLTDTVHMLLPHSCQRCCFYLLVSSSASLTNNFVVDPTGKCFTRSGCSLFELLSRPAPRQCPVLAALLVSAPDVIDALLSYFMTMLNQE